jgi:F-type H+-transporting ATPase subunit gamma
VSEQGSIEEIQARLDNIRSVEPILGAMRTISLGSWQSALRRKDSVLRYAQDLLRILPHLVPRLGRSGQSGHDSLTPRTMALMTIGSERGLCGAYNSSLVRYVESELEQFRRRGIQVELHVLGARLGRMIGRAGHEIVSLRSLPMTSLPSNALAAELTRTFLERYEAFELDAVYLAYHAYRNSTTYEATTIRLIPPPLPSPAEATSLWPPPYVDTEPMHMYVRLIVLWTTTEMYRILLDSAASEHSARYQLMEGATQNSQRLIDELTLALQAARQQAITNEMIELAAGAGLMGEES